MPSNTYEYFKYVIIIQLLFGIGATMMQHSLPEQTYVDLSSQIVPEDIESMEDISTNFTERMDAIQNPPINLPFVDTAFILFYTGNLVIDAFINSLFAIPSMFTVLISGFAIFIPIYAPYKAILQLFVYSVVAILYIIGIIGVLMNLRSQGGLTNAV